MLWLKAMNYKHAAKTKLLLQVKLGRNTGTKFLTVFIFNVFISPLCLYVFSFSTSTTNLE